ncbi:hypothetical protein POM88_002409 [Heracleum sosnowskyi]|uniref:GRF-type domain-containing protein n=1 Tax=Heracleum sosnowskyi TaxID=360622 RepID=A0AAD8JEN3_9APIA|nr:hypothetical protein POM88_002409 [Heracleum sosnowskyi]
MRERCVCGNWVVQQTSWTQANPGRRFMVCSDRRCNLSFQWLEEPVCARAQAIIPGLIRRINNLEEEKTALELALKKAVVQKNRNCHCSWPLFILPFILVVLMILIIFKLEDASEI